MSDLRRKMVCLRGKRLNLRVNHCELRGKASELREHVTDKRTRTDKKPQETNDVASSKRRRDQMDLSSINVISLSLDPLYERRLTSCCYRFQMSM